VLVSYFFCHQNKKKSQQIFVCLVHIHRLIYDYGNYTLDISGPLMINTQKLTALAFAFFDGYRSKQRAKLRRPDDDKENSPLTDDQEKQKITDIPTPMEFLSYIFYFHGIIVGPLCFFKDYRDFIEGRNLLVIPTSKTTTEPSDDEQRLSKIEQPSNFWPVVTKLGQGAIWAYIFLVYTPYYAIEYNISPEMVNSPFFKRLFFLSFSTFCSRAK
jgi:lysophospholipid acyltransferase 1/2